MGKKTLFLKNLPQMKYNGILPYPQCLTPEVSNFKPFSFFIHLTFPIRFSIVFKKLNYQWYKYISLMCAT